jgi:hypothetical protein
MPKTLTLIVRAYCHLCDEMLTALQPIARAHHAIVEVIDVDVPGNSSLEAAWGDKVPVLFEGTPGGGMLLCHYHLDEAKVTRALREQPSTR